MIGGSKIIKKTFTYPAVILFTKLFRLKKDKIHPPINPTNIVREDSFRIFIFLFFKILFPKRAKNNIVDTISTSLITYTSLYN